MEKASPWDFREIDERKISNLFEQNGYVVQTAKQEYLEPMKQILETSLQRFSQGSIKTNKILSDAHCSINNENSNNARLYIMQAISKTTEFNKNYYLSAQEIIHTLCGNELAMQKVPGLSINLPGNEKDILPIHADTWNGVSPYELNIWIPFVDCSGSMCLYILDRKAYKERLKHSKYLLRLTADEIFEELKGDLTWLPIKYGQLLAFDQSLPHGFSLNEEERTHWSLNCRFKGLHTPYWDKKLGEYFMPITVKSITRLGMNYEHPKNWI